MKHQLPYMRNAESIAPSRQGHLLCVWHPQESDIGSHHVQASSYEAFLDPMAKLALFASGIHQLVFTLKSTLPFAVGQVQDVGLIFLSAMASSIAHICTNNDRPTAEALGTTLLTLAICTFLVGLGGFPQADC